MEIKEKKRVIMDKHEIPFNLDQLLINFEDPTCVINMIVNFHDMKFKQTNNNPLEEVLKAYHSKNTKEIEDKAHKLKGACR